MPKTSTPRDLGYASKSSLGDVESSQFQNSGGNARKPSTSAPARNIVGDQGVENLNAKGRGVATPSDEQETPTKRRVRAAKARGITDEAMNKAIALVAAKKSTARSDYEN